MPWNETHLITCASNANGLSDQLMEWGAQAVTFEDAEDHPLYEPSPETPRLWPKTRVIGLFDINDDLTHAIHYFKSQIGNKIFSYEIKAIPDEDWERRCLDRFKPMRFGKRLWICPSWHTPPSPNAVNIRLDPGLAFGTGTHPTTALCLEWLDSNIHANPNVIDFGCGSGILGIAAKKLGAKKVWATDNDPQALLSTKANAEQNLIDLENFIILPVSTPIEQKADVLVANILAQPLIELAPLFASMVIQNGYILLSGILNNQKTAVISAYSPFFMIKCSTDRDNWVRIEATRK